MNPIVEQFSEKNDELTFTISGINVSLANAIRRTILSDIDIVVFRTSPYERNEANILVALETKCCSVETLTKKKICQC